MMVRKKIHNFWNFPEHLFRKIPSSIYIEGIILASMQVLSTSPSFGRRDTLQDLLGNHSLVYRIRQEMNYL